MCPFSHFSLKPSDVGGKDTSSGSDITIRTSDILYFLFYTKHAAMNLVASDIISNIGASEQPNFHKEYPVRRTFNAFLFLMHTFDQQCHSQKGTIAACSLAVAELSVHIWPLLVDCIVILQVNPSFQ